MDRFVDAEWMALAAAVARGEILAAALRARLADDIPGIQVQRKTLGIIKRMWFPEDQAARDLSTAAAHVAEAGAGDRTAAFEAVAICSYPYFRQVIENVGRLLRLQETCSSGEIHRRMFEQHGKRSTIDQATSYAFKTMGSWDMIRRRPDLRLTQSLSMRITPSAKRLLDVAANMSRCSVTPLHRADPLLFPFTL